MRVADARRLRSPHEDQDLGPQPSGRLGHDWMWMEWVACQPEVQIAFKEFLDIARCLQCKAGTGLGQWQTQTDRRPLRLYCHNHPRQ